MMKKWLVGLLLVSFSVSVCGCGAEEATMETTEEISEVSSAADEVVEEISLEEVKEESEPIIEVIADEKSHSEEYNAAFETGKKCCASYSPDGKAAVYDSWQEGFKALIEDISYDDSTAFALAYINNDDVPELVYKLNSNTVSLASFDSTTGELNIAACNHGTDIFYIEKGNVIKANGRVEASYLDSLFAIKDNQWISLAEGRCEPLDAWAEDSFDENGEPIISHWEINSKEFSSQKDYDEELSKYLDENFAEKIFEFKEPDAVIKIIDEL